MTANMNDKNRILPCSRDEHCRSQYVIQ